MIGSIVQPVAKTKRILVVDDLPDNSFLLQIFLEVEGYQVEVAHSGQSALTMIDAAPPNLILLDVMMPEMDGFEVTRRIRQNPQLPFIPIVLVTGYEEPIAAEGFELGANGFLRKPVQFQDLLEQIQTLLREASHEDRYS